MKIQQNNKTKNISINIPKQFAEMLGWEKGDEVYIAKASVKDNCLTITKR